MTKLPFYLLLINLLLGAAGTRAQGQVTELTEFLARFKTFEAQFYPKQREPMPVFQPQKGSTAPLPNAVRKGQGFMTDPLTGLQHYPMLGIVYDPKTGLSIAFDPEEKYNVDVLAGKVYQGKEEVKPEKLQKPPYKS